MKRPRDSQRSRLYAAEKAAFGDPRDCALRLASMRELQDYVAAAVTDDWFRAEFGRFASLRVKDGRGTRHAYSAYDPHSGRVLLSFPRWARTRPVVLHELGHAASVQRHGMIAAHGPEFAAVFLQLAGRYLGEPAARCLRDAYRAHRVRYAPECGGAVDWVGR